MFHVFGVSVRQVPLSVLESIDQHTLVKYYAAGRLSDRVDEIIRGQEAGLHLSKTDVKIFGKILDDDCTTPSLSLHEAAKFLRFVTHLTEKYRPRNVVELSLAPRSTMSNTY